MAGGAAGAVAAGLGAALCTTSLILGQHLTFTDPFAHKTQKGIGVQMQGTSSLGGQEIRVSRQNACVSTPQHPLGLMIAHDPCESWHTFCKCTDNGDNLKEWK